MARRCLAAAALALALAGGAANAEPDGKALFLGGAEPACAICHTLADAGSAGEIGPNLDALRPAVDKVRAAVISGVGVMPAYAELLSDEEIAALSAYVAAAAGS